MARRRPVRGSSPLPPSSRATGTVPLAISSAGTSDDIGGHRSARRCRGRTFLDLLDQVRSPCRAARPGRHLDGHRATGGTRLGDVVGELLEHARRPLSASVSWRGRSAASAPVPAEPIVRVAATMPAVSESSGWSHVHQVASFARLCVVRWRPLDDVVVLPISFSRDRVRQVLVHPGRRGLCGIGGTDRLVGCPACSRRVWARCPGRGRCTASTDADEPGDPRRI